MNEILHVPVHKKELSHIDVSSLIPYANNARTHSDEQVAQIAASIREFGFTNPILVDGENGLIAGHGRLLAARKLGMEDVPAIVIDYLSDAQKRALVIADNKLALNAGWEMDLLACELEDLMLLDFDLSLTGFTEHERVEISFDGNFEPGSEEDQGKLDELDPKYCTCPNCGKEFDLREQG